MQVLRLRRFVIVCHLTFILSITSFVLVDEKNKTFSRCNELKLATCRFLLELSALFFGNVASAHNYTKCKMHSTEMKEDNLDRRT